MIRLLFLMFFLFGRFGHRKGNKAFACGNVVEQIRNATGTTWFIDGDECFSYMGRGSFHVPTGGFIKKMCVEILSERCFGLVEVLEKETSFRIHILKLDYQDGMPAKRAIGIDAPKVAET